MEENTQYVPVSFDVEEGDFNSYPSPEENEGQEPQAVEDEDRIEDAEDDEGDGSHYEGDFR